MTCSKRSKSNIPCGQSAVVSLDGQHFCALHAQEYQTKKTEKARGR